MNTIIDFLKNKYVLGTIIMLMIFLIIYLLTDNFIDTFENLTGLKSPSTSCRKIVITTNDATRPTSFRSNSFYIY